MKSPNASGFVILAWLLLTSPIVCSQEKDVECGPNCVEVALHCFEVDFEYASFRREFGTPQSSGYSMADLERIAQHYGLKTRTVITNTERLQQRSKSERFVCICWQTNNHFVILNDILSGNQVQVIDPPNCSTIPTSTYLAQWNGAALLLSNDDLMNESELRSNSRWLLLAALIGFVGLSCLPFWRLRK